MLDLKTTSQEGVKPEASGEFASIDGVRFYVIRDVDKMPPFFISLASPADHWLFVSCTGGLTAGRVSPEGALFPYIPVDRIHESTLHTGSRTMLRVASESRKDLVMPTTRSNNITGNMANYRRCP